MSQVQMLSIYQHRSCLNDQNMGKWHMSRLRSSKYYSQKINKIKAEIEYAKGNELRRTLGIQRIDPSMRI